MTLQELKDQQEAYHVSHLCIEGTLSDLLKKLNDADPTESFSLVTEIKEYTDEMYDLAVKIEKLQGEIDKMSEEEHEVYQTGPWSFQT
jgi:hypothetical protein